MAQPGQHGQEANTGRQRRGGGSEQQHRPQKRGAGELTGQAGPPMYAPGGRAQAGGQYGDGDRGEDRDDGQDAKQGGVAAAGDQCAAGDGPSR